jgi:two-component system NtrC family sensor kinase
MMQLLSRFRRGRVLERVPAVERASVRLLDQCADGVLVLGQDGRVISANAAAAEMLGRSVERLLGQRIRDFVARDQHLVVDRALRATRDEGPQRFEVRRPATQDQEEDRILAFASSSCETESIAAADAGAAAVGSLLTLRDVTEERRAANELARSEARYHHLFEGASGAIMTFDALGRFTTINGAGESLAGYQRDELIGRFFGPLLAIESLPKALIEFRRALSGVSGQFDAVMVRKGGDRRYITVNYACPQRSREVLCFIRDATAGKQLQEQLIQAEKMAAIGQLVSGVAHELNNPLASISAYAQLLLAEASLSDDQKHSAEVIRGEARRAARIVHNLLTFARQHKAEKRLADLNVVAEDTLELRAYELNVRGIKLVRDFDPVPPETMIDVYQIQQVLLNLTTNAEQAMAEVENRRHQLTVRTRTLPDVIRIEVEDTGSGIPAESQALVFNPFYTTKPTGQGTGLGLSISLGIVGEHNGRIWAENVPGSGCRFTLELPRLAASSRAPVIAPNAPRASQTGLRILVADDEEPIRTALERFLTMSGHAVVTVSSGSETIWRCEGDEVFDVILLDIRMPDVSGRQIFERWRREHRELRERTIFLTGDIVSTDLQSFLVGTGRPFVAKPFEFDAILRVLPAKRVG